MDARTANQLAGIDAVGQAALVTSGELSATDLLEAAILRLDATRRLNAVITDLFERGRAQAAALDAERWLAAHPADLLLVGSRHHWMEGSLARLLLYKLPLDIQICHEPHAALLKAVG